MPPSNWNQPQTGNAEKSHATPTKILTCDDLELSLSKKVSQEKVLPSPSTVDKPSFIPLQAITGRKNPSFKVSQRQMEKKHDEQKETNCVPQHKTNEVSVKNPHEHSRPPRTQRQSRLAAKFHTGN